MRNKPACDPDWRDGADGIPIEQIFPTDPEVVKTLRRVGINTVELCAKLAPGGINALGGTRALNWKKRAQRYLKGPKNAVSLWEIVEAMTNEQRRELKEIIADERREAWNAAVELIAEGLEMEVDDRATRADRIRKLKDMVPR